MGLNDRVIRKLASTISGLERRLSSQERSAQLAHTSIEGGSMEVYDDDDQLVQEVGVDEEGDPDFAYLEATVPPAPTDPVLKSRPGAVGVLWDGEYVDEPEVVVSHVNVHLSEIDGAEPDAENLVTTIPVGGGQVVLSASAGHDVEVTLVTVSSSGVQSDPSATVQVSVTEGATQQQIDDIETGGGGSDGDPPASSPDIDLTGAQGVILGRWLGVLNADRVSYEVHISDSSFTAVFEDASTRLDVVDSTMIAIRQLADGTLLDYDTDYYVQIIAFDADGAAAPGAEASAQMDRTKNADLVADAIDGMVITGATFRTASSGLRSQLDEIGFRTFDPSESETSRLEALTGGLRLAGNLLLDADGTVTGILDLGGTGLFRTSEDGNRVEVNTDGVVGFGGLGTPIGIWPLETEMKSVSALPGGNVATLSYDDRRIQAFDPEGNQLLNFDPSPITTAAAHMAADGDGYFWIFDPTNASSGRLRRYDDSGSQVGSWSFTMDADDLDADADGNCYVLDDVAGTDVRVFDTSGSEIESFSATGQLISVAPDGTIWTLNLLPENIYHYDATGTLIDSFSIDEGVGSTPQDIAVGPDGTVFVSYDTGSGAQVKAIDPDDGSTILAWDARGAVDHIDLSSEGVVIVPSWLDGTVTLYAAGEVISAQVATATGLLTAVSAKFKGEMEADLIKPRMIRSRDPINIKSEQQLTLEGYPGVVIDSILAVGNIDVLSPGLIHGDSDVEIAGAPVTLNSDGILWGRSKNDTRFITDGFTLLNLESSSGNIELPNHTTTGSSANVNLTSNGNLRRVTSSLRYKARVEGLELDPKSILRAEPSRWKNKEDQELFEKGDPIPGPCPKGDEAEREMIPPPEPPWNVGFIAEQLDEVGLEDFVIYDDEGRPDAIAYPALTAAVVPLLRVHEQRIADLEARLAAIEGGAHDD